MNYEGADMELREKDDRMAALKARIAELEAERERVKMLAEAWRNAGTGLRDYHDCARQLLAAMNPEEEKQP